MQQYFAVALLAALTQATRIQQSDGAIQENYPTPDSTVTGVDQDIDYYRRDMTFLDGTRTGDAETQPLCAIAGNQGEPSHEMPSDFCCRVYELPDFVGRYMDFCSTDRSHKLSTHFDLLTYGWIEEVSSWKCGHRVNIWACTANKEIGETCD